MTQLKDRKKRQAYKKPLKLLSPKQNKAVMPLDGSRPGTLEVLISTSVQQ